MVSKTEESRPPEKPTSTTEPGLRSGESSASARASSRALTASLDFCFLVLAIRHEPVKALFEQLLRLLVGEPPERLLQCLLQVLRTGGWIAVRAAQRLRDD